MGPESCPECLAIYRQLADSVRQHHVASQPLADWIRQVDGYDCSRIRQTSVLWAIWRRLQNHPPLAGTIFLCCPSPRLRSKIPIDTGLRNFPLMFPAPSADQLSVGDT